MTTILMQKAGQADIAVKSSQVAVHEALGWSRKKVEISTDGLTLSVPPGTALDLDGAVTGGDLVQSYFVDQANGDPNNDGMSFGAAFDTIQAAVDAAAAGAKIYIASGGYDETVSIDKALTLIGDGPRGSVYIEPSTVGAEGMDVLADDVTLINVGVAGEETASYAIRVGSQTVSPDRFRAYGSKFEGSAGASVIFKGAGDALLYDCESAWADKGITFDDNDNGYCTQISIVGHRFHNITTAHVGVEAGGLVKDLLLSECKCLNSEDGTPPTDYILLSDNANFGLIEDNTFACATNDAAVLTIGTGLLWVANKTEAGVSTARPA